MGDYYLHNLSHNVEYSEEQMEIFEERQRKGKIIEEFMKKNTHIEYGERFNLAFEKAQKSDDIVSDNESDSSLSDGLNID